MAYKATVDGQGLDKQYWLPSDMGDGGKKTSDEVALCVLIQDGLPLQEMTPDFAAQLQQSVLEDVGVFLRGEKPAAETSET